MVINVGTGISYSVKEISEMIGGESIHLPPRIGEAKITLADNTLAKLILEWNPKVMLKDWISIKKWAQTQTATNIY